MPPSPLSSTVTEQIRLQKQRPKKVDFFGSKGYPIGVPRGRQSPQNSYPEASRNRSWKKNRNGSGKLSKSGTLDLPKPCEGSRKSRFSCFRKRSQNGSPEASLLEPFWVPKSSQTRSRRVPENPRKKCPGPGGPGVEKGYPKWDYFLIPLGYVLAILALFTTHRLHRRLSYQF